MRKKILLLDTNFSAKPIYDYLVNTGAEVYVVGGRPHDALAKSAENYINLDYSNIGEVKSLIERLKIDFLVPGGNDFSYKVCAEINQDFGFYNIDSVEVNETINHKEKFRRISTNLNLNVPRLVEAEDIKDNLPVIVKPVDAYSGHGMTVLLDANCRDLKKATKLAKSFSKSGNYLIEEYVQGQLFSHSAFIVDGEILIDFIVEEHCTVNPYVVDTSRVVYDFDSSIRSLVAEDITKLAKELKLPDGLIHTQFIYNGHKFWLIEVTRRCPGDLYSNLIVFSTGFPYVEAYTRPFINKTQNNSNFDMNKSLVFRHTITSDKPVIFTSLTFNHPINILEYVPLSLTGDKIEESPFSRIGILFGLATSEADFSIIFNKIINRKLYFIKSERQYETLQ